MNTVEAIALLSSEDSDRRLAAARHLAQNATVSDRRLIAKALRVETESWTREALKSALERTKVGVKPVDNPARIEDQEAQSEKSYDRAVEEMLRVVLHEIENVVGRIRARVSKELQDFKGSETERQFNKLDSRIDAIRQFGHATRSSSTMQFDLGELIRRLVEDERESATIFLDGPEELLVSSDRGKVLIAVTMGLRNAVESTIEVADIAGENNVCISWGVADKYFWISITDEGVGFEHNTEKLMEHGFTTKSRTEHSGIGLAIAKKAVSSLGGHLYLFNKEGRGASFNIEIPLNLDGTQI
jgi:signal transduction histidine kinase